MWRFGGVEMIVGFWRFVPIRSSVEAPSTLGGVEAAVAAEVGTACSEGAMT